MIAFAMYDGVVNVYLTSGNWKKSFAIKNEGAPTEMHRTSHHSLRRKSGLLDTHDLQEGEFAESRLIQRAKDEFFLRDGLAINAISWLSSISTNNVWVTAGMDGFVRLFDCLDGSMCGKFDSGHLSEKPNINGEYDRLPVLCMASDPDQTMLATTDDLGRIRAFEVSTVTNEVINLELKIHAADGLVAADANGFSDPYVKVAFRAGVSNKSQEAQTKVISKTLAPSWEENFKFLVGSGNRHEIMKHHWALHFTVYDYDRFGGHDELGITSLDVYNLKFGQEKTQWLILADPDPEPGVLPKPHGKLRVTVRLDVQYQQPEVYSEWQAHHGPILNMHLTKPSTTIDGSPIPLIISCGSDNKIKVWTQDGVLVGKLGFSHWDARVFLKARNQGQKRRAELLMQKQKHENELLDLQMKLDEERLEKERQLQEQCDEIQEEREERERKLAKEVAKQEYIKRLENSDDVNDRVKAVSEKMGIPNETYESEYNFAFLLMIFFSFNLQNRLLYSERASFLQC